MNKLLAAHAGARRKSNRSPTRSDPIGSATFAGGDLPSNTSTMAL